jgi:hypothetical protein
MLLAIEIGLFAAFFTLFINYCIGKPGSEFSPYEIFSSYTVWLSIKRLQNIGLYSDYAHEYNENLKRVNTIAEILRLKNDFKKQLYEAAEPFFTWERAAGMCPVCFGFWVALITSLFFTHNFFVIACIVVISHTTIRILNKLL